jgi:hypothetical protein
LVDEKSLTYLPLPDGSMRVRDFQINRKQPALSGNQPVLPTLQAVSAEIYGHGKRRVGESIRHKDKKN